MRSPLVLLASALAFSTCVPILVPASTAVRSGPAAFAEVGGVRAWAEGTWTGFPANLPDYVTPVHVTLENRSGRTVRLAYQDFALRGGTGVRYAALPPFSIPAAVGDAAAPGTVVLADYHPAKPVTPHPPPRPVHPRIHVHRFFVAPPYAGVYVGFPLWPHLWAWNAAYYAQWRPLWPSALPSDDMLQRALPEGALEDGGVVSGFVYFQHAGREANVTLELSLHDAQTGDALGTAALPFVVQR